MIHFISFLFFVDARKEGNEEEEEEAEEKKVCQTDG
jgi:hypothetical protein